MTRDSQQTTVAPRAGWGWRKIAKFWSMRGQPKSDVPLFMIAVAISRFLFRSHFLYDLDSVNFALGIERFDPRTYQPHPPGYFLYICLGRLLNSALHNANLSLVVLSIAASCGAIAVIYQMALEWFNQRTARFAALLFLISPLAWFHGTVALTYSVEAFYSALLGYLCWRIAQGHSQWIVAAGILLGVSAGVRPSSLLFLGPLFVFALRTATRKRQLAGLAALGVALLAWFVPMIVASGGLDVYLSALLSLWQLVPAKDTVFNSSPGTSIARASTIVFIYALGFGAAAIAPLGARYRKTGIASEKKLFTAVWIAPALVFFTFIFLKFVNSGYLLILAAPACLWLGFWAAEWYDNCHWSQPARLATIAACIAANVLLFLFSPLYCSYRSVRQLETQLKKIQAALPQIGSAQDTMIVGFDSHFLGYRHAGYYLPSYLTVQYPAVHLLEGTRIFAMQDRDTWLLAGMPINSCTRFVLFPLPSDDPEYPEYLSGVRSRLPANSLRVVRADGINFVTGPLADLPYLFPSMSSRPVYVLHHSEAPPVTDRLHPSGPQAP